MGDVCSKCEGVWGGPGSTYCGACGERFCKTCDTAPLSHSGYHVCQTSFLRDVWHEFPITADWVYSAARRGEIELNHNATMYRRLR